MFTYDKIKGPLLHSHTTADVVGLSGEYVQKAGDTMTGDLNFTGKGISTADYVKLNVLYTPTNNEPIGSIYWHETDGTFNLVLKNGSILQAGQELHFYGKASGNILNGDPVQFAGVQGDHLLVKKAVAAEINTNPEYFIGVATQNINNGDFGYVTWFGKINGVYTKTPANNDSADWLNGDILYLNMTTGYLTKTAPTAPTRNIIVAAVIKEQTGASENGIILVRPTIGMKLGDLDDVDGSAPNATGDLLSWNNSTQTWERNAYNITDYSPITIDTEQNITTSSPTIKKIAYSTDKHLFYIADGTNWKVLPINMVTESSAPDGGVDQWGARTGYGIDYISDKRISHSAIGDNSNTTEGSIRTASGEYQIYLNGQWNTIVINFRFLEDSTEGYQLEHRPVGFNGYYDVSSGNSDAIGNNGLPLTQNYSTVGGADGIPLLISGGTF